MRTCGPVCGLCHIYVNEQYGSNILGGEQKNINDHSLFIMVRFVDKGSYHQVYRIY